MDTLPQDLHDYIASGKGLEYDSAECDVGNVKLVSIDQLRSSLFSMDCDDTDVVNEDPNKDGSGCYLVEGVDLIHDSDGDYGAEGLLIWFPLDRRYGAWDNSHNKIFVFDEGTCWSDIVAAPVAYLNAQWEFGDGKSVSCLKPWTNHVYNQEQIFRRLPYPAEWLNVEQTLRGEYVDDVQIRIPRMAKVDLESKGNNYELTATVSHMDEDSNWVVDENVSRTLDANEQSDLQQMIQANFWNAVELETDYSEPVFIWRLERYEGKRFRSHTLFYSERSKRDCFAELGQWVVNLAGITPLESHLS